MTPSQSLALEADACLLIDVLGMLSHMFLGARFRYKNRSSISSAIPQTDSACKDVHQNAYTDTHFYIVRHRGVDMMPKISHRRTSH